MSNPRNTIERLILLLDPIDGKAMERFILLEGLRLGGDEIYAPEHGPNEKFEPGKTYGLIIVTSRTQHFAASKAHKIAEAFSGLVHERLAL